MSFRGVAGSILSSLILWALVGCSDGGESPGLAISNLRVLAPVPATRVGVAYCQITNAAATGRRLVSVASPQFQRAELHATIREGDQVQMHQLSQVALAPNATTHFEEGRLHIMLWDPLPELSIGDAVQLEFAFADGLAINVSTTLRSRLD